MEKGHVYDGVIAQDDTQGRPLSVLGRVGVDGRGGAPVLECERKRW